MYDALDRVSCEASHSNRLVAIYVGRWHLGGGLHNGNVQLNNVADAKLCPNLAKD